MGCGSSQPLSQESDEYGADAHHARQGAQNVDMDKDGSTNSAEATSIPVEADAGGIVQVKHADSRPSSAHRESTSTRARRLSYVSGDTNASRLTPEGGSQGASEPSGGVSASNHIYEVHGSPDRPIRLIVACMSKSGREPGFKKTNQDSCFAFEKYITEDQSLFGAMDGHGPNGHLVSSYIKQHLPIILVNQLAEEKSVAETIASAFMEIDKGLAKSKIDCEFSGSTAVVSYLKAKTLRTAWVGDSRAVLAREGPEGLEPFDLTFDHKPTTPAEKARILKCNGRVEQLVDETGEPMGPHRVWLQHAWIPGLAMSRALGDGLAHQAGVSSEPDHTSVDLTEKDKFAILASDGVWEFISSEEAVQIVASCGSVEESCKKLVDEAYRRWMVEEEGVVDDITAVVIQFLHA